MPEEDAVKVATLMVEASISGYGRHCVFRRRQYLARLSCGGCNPTLFISVEHRTTAAALIDCDDGPGHRAMSAARTLAIMKARTAGCGRVESKLRCYAGTRI